jgi:2-amino-4-hydroxy-6-hydroxymethyldihydropteridine diphosphokinase
MPHGKAPSTVAIGLGANLGDPEAQVERAIRELERVGRVAARSSLFRSEPWGVRDQPEFVNAAVLLETSLDPYALLAALQRIEAELGRIPGERWGPRAIDLDVLFYDGVELDDPALTLPHPRLRERAFALAPLAEVDARWQTALDSLGPEERRKVKPLRKGESVALMSEDLVARVRALADAFVQTDLVRLRVEEPNEDAIELRRPVPVATASEVEVDGSAETSGIPARPLEAVKADLVGVVRFGRPAPTEGELVAGERDLAYVEALGIRTPVRAAGGGRLAAIRCHEGEPVEYGQVLFEIDRG